MSKQKILNKHTIDDAISYLILNTRENSFYAYILQQLDYIKDLNVKTMGVGIIPGNGIALFFNPFFITELTFQELLGVLEHEALHIIHEHPARILAFPDKDKYNRAADLVVNKNITFDLPKGCEDIKEYLKDWKTKTADEIYYLLPNSEKDKKQKNQKSQYIIDGNGKKRRVIDDHTKWNKLPESLRDKARQIIRKALERTNGTMPNGLEEIITKLLNPKIAPQEILKHYIRKHLKAGRYSTWMKRNRRFGNDLPGYKSDHKFHICNLVDTSSSVPLHDEIQIFSIINAFDTSAKQVIIENDADVSLVFDYKKGEKIRLRGRGGTVFDPAIKKANELHKKKKFDVAIFWTDGYANTPSVKPLMPMCWVITSRGIESNLPKKDLKIRL